MLPTADFFGTQVTRMIIGDNPVNGHSYIPDYITGEEMSSYYTPEKTVELLFWLCECGYNTILPLACPKSLAAIREFYRLGGKLNIIFQPYPAVPLEKNMEEMMELDPIAIYHQGTTTDYLTETGNVETLQKNLEIIRSGGIPVGLATHVPETVLQSEHEKWDVDFYMACLYNARRDRRGEQSGFISGKTKAGLIFYPEDRFEMFRVIQSVQKPFIAYKILAGGQIFDNIPPAEHPAVFEQYVTETYQNIKPTDITCIGVFQRDYDYAKQNADIVGQVLQSL